ncbi:MAG: DEAD/DEAH box helicase family protein, partial [Thermoanaerobaculaceae bacterium]|nr:DEAD/DEAH box helicase family protein [Thermoanaerobaculaceae bacterium]
MSTFPAVDQFIRESQDWPSFFAATTQLPERARGGKPDKGKVFERLTQLLLITLPEYQTKLRHVWLARDVPPDVRAKTGLPENDEGVDLVAETHEDQYWAVQSKFITDTQKRLTVGKLSTFLNTAFNVCRNVSLAVVVDTCSKPVLKSGLLGRTTEIGLDRWLALDDEQWGRIRTATSTPAPPPVPLSPRPHQEAAVKAAATHFVERNERRGRLIMPCGTGKSLTAFWVARSLDAQSIVVAVPSLALIKQSLAGWTREYLAHGEVPDWLCVCSDETTGNIEHDEFVGKVYQLGVDAHTDPEQIADFLRLRGAPRKIVFVTYQSGEVLATAARKAGFEFDLAILDEAHRTVGDRDRTFAHLLSDENIRIKRRLFMTATERVVRGADDEVLSMDDARVYGRRFFQLTFKQAIESDPPIISDYKIVTMTISDEHVRDLVERNRSLQTSHETLGEREAQALAAGITLQRTFEEEGTRHAISFHRSIRAAQDFRDQHEKIVALRQESRKTACFHVSSHRTTGERTQILDQFTKSPKAVITNARCLQEGVDIPSVDCILFADPKQSVVDIVQAAGRALRPFPGKRFGYIVVPIVVPSGMSFDTFAETTAFKQVARVIAALSTQDDRIAEEFRVAVNLPRSGGRIVEIRGDVPLAHQIGFEEFRERVLLKIW